MRCVVYRVQSQGGSATAACATFRVRKNLRSSDSCACSTVILVELRGGGQRESARASQASRFARVALLVTVLPENPKDFVPKMAIFFYAGGARMMAPAARSRPHTEERMLRLPRAVREPTGNLEPVPAKGLARYCLTKQGRRLLAAAVRKKRLGGRWGRVGCWGPCEVSDITHTSVRSQHHARRACAAFVPGEPPLSR